MSLTVLYFAKARSIMGCSRETFELERDVGSLLKRLAAVHPDLTAVLTTCAVAVNEKYAQKTQILCDGDVVAIIPPVSGG